MMTNHFYKKRKYNQLAIDCEAKGWKVHPICVEVGCRGHPPGWLEMVHTLGFTRAESKQLKYRLEAAALHCSYVIFACRYQYNWIPKPLLDVSAWHQYR